MSSRIKAIILDNCAHRFSLHSKTNHVTLEFTPSFASSSTNVNYFITVDKVGALYLERKHMLDDFKEYYFEKSCFYYFN